MTRDKHLRGTVISKEDAVQYRVKLKLGNERYVTSQKDAFRMKAKAAG
jgi:hypothetical protein